MVIGETRIGIGPVTKKPDRFLLGYGHITTGIREAFGTDGLKRPQRVGVWYENGHPVMNIDGVIQTVKEEDLDRVNIKEDFPGATVRTEFRYVPDSYPFPHMTTFILHKPRFSDGGKFMLPGDDIAVSGGTLRFQRDGSVLHTIRKSSTVRSTIIPPDDLDGLTFKNGLSSKVFTLYNSDQLAGMISAEFVRRTAGISK